MEEIKSEVLAEEVILDQTEGYQKEWSINGENVTFGVKRV